MMVEAGGTEKSFYYYADGAPKVDEAVLAGGLDACKVVDQGVDRPPASAPRQCDRHVGHDRAAQVQPGDRLRRRCRYAVEGAVSAEIGQAVTISLKSERNAAIDAATDKAIAALCGTAEALRVSSPAARRRSRRQSARSPRSSSGVASSTRACASTVAELPTCARSRPRSACCPRRTVPACSSVARRR